MTETGQDKSVRSQCERISQMLSQGHKLLDDLMGPDVLDNKAPGLSQSQGTIKEIEIALAKIDEKAKGLISRLEALCKQL